ncbi:MAG: carboxypeptidase regulatory-like domain-containing protein, partial [Bacteroidaceae bacterium]|nr:carboxypeptidase regulatory-like domain-containing protein [Bacteroidaceae bacterium]
TNEEPYTAQLLSPQGVLIASTDTLTLSGQPMEMTFKTVQPMHTVQLTVQTPAEEEGGNPTDVTDQTTIVWMDAMGNRLGTGSTLARQVEGTRLLYGITLPTDLAARYGVPPRTELLVKEATAQTTVTLAQPDTIILSGKVTDTDGKPISMATVTASLMMNGTVGKVFTATTNALGRYELTALTGDLTLSASASGYVAARRAFSVVGGSSTDIAPIQLAPLSGPTIHYDFTYTAATTADEEATTLPYYNDYQNVVVAAYNETTGEALDSLMVQYPEVQLLDGAKAGDRIRLTASSLKDAFMPVEVTVTLTDEEEKADSVTFALKELGGVEVSFLRTSNQAVTAVLYDADGLLCQQETFAEASLTLTGLKDGDYTVVTMGSDPLLSKMLYLSDYTAVGMEADKDYVSNKVKVESGIIAEVTNDRIPTLNTAQFYYTDDTKTLFMSNKTEVSTSCNVTLRAEIGFKEDIKERVSNVRLLVTYPTNMAEFVEGSSMTGTKMVRATAEEGKVTIPVENDYLDEPTRFILTALDQGTLIASAQVQFDIDGSTVTQPIGFATCDVKYMTIVAPKKIHKLSFPVRGMAPALSSIRVYAGNNLMVGETEALADGSWQLHVELPECPNLTTIPVYAVITTKQGREAKTERVEVNYTKDMVHPLHVYMFPPLADEWLQEGRGTSTGTAYVDFDFEHPETLKNQWYVAYFHAGKSNYTFEIVFNTTDQTKVKDVILIYETKKGVTDYLEANYDSNTGHWFCSVDLPWDAVTTVDVDYLDESDLQMDADQQFAQTHFVEYYKELMTALNEEVERIITALASETNTDKRRQLMNELAELIGVDVTGIDTKTASSITPEELFVDIEETLGEDAFDMNEFINGFDQYNMDMGKNMSIDHTTGLSPQQLLDEGYNAILMTDGNTLYELVEDGHYVMVDFQNDFRLETTNGKAAEALARYSRARNEEDFSTKVNRTLGEIMSWYDQLNTAYNVIKKGAVDACLALQPMISNLTNKIELFYRVYYAPGSPAISPQNQKSLVNMCTKKAVLENLNDAMSQMAIEGLDIAKETEKYQQLAPKTFLGKAMSGALKVFSGIGQVFSYVAILSDLKEGYDRVNELNSIWREVPDPCTEDQFNATSLRKDIEDFAMYQGWYFIALATSDVLATEAIDKGVKAVVGSGGLSMSSVFGGISATLIKMGANYLNDRTFEDKVSHYQGSIRLLQCDKEYRKKQDAWFRARLIVDNREQRPKVQTIIDPSGYVYEAVADNRVEGATATIYFKQTGEDEYGDLHDEVVKWDATEFRQENPLLTDAEGKYAWDVPQGLWQVKVEKAGYETAYSDWLPVPPPQLDINIPLVRNTLPDVQAARAYEDGVEVTFNEYMRPESLTTERLMLSQNRQPLTCTISQQNRSKAYNSKDTYVSRIKVKTNTPLASGSKVQLTVRRQVEAYNGLQMQKDYQQEFTVVREVYAIGTDSIVEVAKGEERTITIHAFPASAAQGMKVTAKSVIGTIATVTGEATFDANGEAHLTVTGKVGGQTALFLSLENSKVTAQSVIMVEDPSLLPVYAPTASHISGTYLMEDEKVTLSCETKDAVIWYTTDGTCPCDENGTRHQYTAPISITEAVTIRAYAVKGDDVSRVVTFTYGIYDPVGIRETTTTEEAETWYTVGGVRLATKPTAKGVYIVNGKKVVVK